MKSPRSILIVKLSSIGDVVMSMPVARALKQAYPEARVSWLVEGPARPLIEACPYVDQVLEFPKARGLAQIKAGQWLSVASQARSFVKGLRRERFDVALDLQGLLRSGVLTWLSGASRRIGRQDAREGGRLFINERVAPSAPRTRAAQQYMDLLRPLGLHESDPSLFVPVSAEDDAAAERFLGSELGAPGERFVALAMSTTFYHKHWPEEQVAGLVDRLFEDYGLRSVMLGSAKDLESQRRVGQLARHAPVLAAGATSLTEAAALMGRAEMVAAVDTGLLWIALAVRAPLVAIFGPTTYEHLADEAAEVACKPFPCAPCLRSATCEDRDCMRALSVDDAMAAVRRVMARIPAPQPVAAQG